MEQKEEQKQDVKNVKKEVMEYIRMIVFLMVVVFVVNNVVLINAKIPSESMEQTIMTNDRIFGFRLAYKFQDPERYDIVIFRYPDDPEQKELFIKRVIGLPGETVAIREGKVYINDAEQPLEDGFCPEDPLGDFGPYTVPEGCYFMLGDNRNYSKDSRFWDTKYVRMDQIVGKALIRYFPSIKRIK